MFGIWLFRVWGRGLVFGLQITRGCSKSLRYTVVTVGADFRASVHFMAMPRMEITFRLTPRQPFGISATLEALQKIWGLFQSCYS